MPDIKPAATAASNLRTLAVDIGGTGLKALVLAADGRALTDRVRVETPRPATPRALLPAIVKLVAPLGAFDRVSVGFPGVVVDGVTWTAPNLHRLWRGFDLASAVADQLGRPVRVLNDAGIQGYGVIAGHGVEMVLTFGTGLGCAVYLDGNYVPNLELAHLPFGNGDTYEEYVGAKALRSQSVAEGITPNQRDQAWYDMTRAMMVSLDQELERRIRENFTFYVQ